ncbi:MAG: DUF4405 domain-containing protein [Bacillota bacterium]
MVKVSNKSNTNFYIDLLIFFPFIILAFSGLLIQINYHAGGLSSETTVLGLNNSGWLNLHKMTAVISLIGIAIHVFLHAGWIKMVFKKKKASGKNAKITLCLLIFFIIVSITGLIPWIFMSVASHARFIAIEFHDKIGIILTVLFIFHLVNHRRWIARKISGTVGISIYGLKPSTR